MVMAKRENDRRHWPEIEREHAIFAIASSLHFPSVEEPELLPRCREWRCSCFFWNGFGMTNPIILTPSKWHALEFRLCPSFIFLPLRSPSLSPLLFLIARREERPKENFLSVSAERRKTIALRHPRHEREKKKLGIL